VLSSFGGEFSGWYHLVGSATLPGEQEPRGRESHPPATKSILSKEPTPSSNQPYRIMNKAAKVGRMLIIAAGCLAVVVALFQFVYRPWQLNWGATEEEIQRTMAGDEIVPDPTFNATRAVTVNAPAERIWPWIVQMGYRKAGFYSWDILDNDGIPSSERIIPEYQTLKVGDLVPLSATAGIRVAALEANTELLLVAQSPTTWTWSWGLYPIDAQRTRLVSRLRLPLRTSSSRLWVDAFEIVMMRKCLLGIKRRAEYRHDGT
jgi:hypothetical protein